MSKIVGTKEAKEISLTRKGANQHAHVLIKKNMAPAIKDDPTEKLDMDAAEITKMLKSVAGMSDVVKGYVAKMPDDKVHEFMRMAPADQEEEANESAAEKTREAAATKALEEGKTAKELETAKALTSAKTEIADLKKRLDDNAATAEIEKRARDEYSTFPGGLEKVVRILKAAALLPEDSRKVIEEGLKAQIAVAALTGGNIGLSEEESAKAAPAAAEVRKKAIELAAEKKISFDAAKAEVLMDPSNADLFMRTLNEEQKASAVN